MKCKCCGNNRFVGHQIIRADVEVDSNGIFVSNLFGGLEAHIYDSALPYGPFTCTKCGAEYDELSETAIPTNMAIKNGKWTSNETNSEVKINRIVEATYTEVWEETIMVTSPCLVDLDTLRIVAVSYNGDTSIDTGNCVGNAWRYVTIGDRTYCVAADGTLLM